jgi:hypothetical protein
LASALGSRETELNSLQRERDQMRLRNEIMLDHLQKNGIDDVPFCEETLLGLIEEYQLKLDSLQRELERRAQEMQVQNLKIGRLQAEKQRDEQILCQKVEDNNKLKRQLKMYEESCSPQKGAKTDNRFKLNL